MKLKYILLALLCLTATYSFAEKPKAADAKETTSSIAKEPKGTDANFFGHILDKKTNEHLPYVTFQIKGTTKGTATDETGHYYITNLPLGEQTVVVKMMGYKTIEQTINVREGETQELNFDLEENTIYFEDVIISADRNGNTRRFSPSLVSVIEDRKSTRLNSSH